MKKAFAITFAAALLIAALMTGCAKDQPPDDGTPSPEPLNGVFVGEYGKLTFNGDGNSIELNVNEKFARLSGIPEGESDGTYVFLFHNESWRRDMAEYFRVTINNKKYIFNNSFGKTDTDTIAFYSPSDSSKEFVFEKQGVKE